MWSGVAHHRLGQADEARQSLAKARRIMETELPQVESGDLGRSWHNWMICQVLRREATELLGATQTPSEPKEESGNTMSDEGRGKSESPNNVSLGP